MKRLRSRIGGTSWRPKSSITNTPAFAFHCCGDDGPLDLDQPAVDRLLALRDLVVDGVDDAYDLVAEGDRVRDLDRRAHEQRHALGDRALAVAWSSEDEQRRAGDHRAT